MRRVPGFNRPFHAWVDRFRDFDHPYDVDEARREVAGVLTTVECDAGHIVAPRVSSRELEVPPCGGQRESHDQENEEHLFDHRSLEGS